MSCRPIVGIAVIVCLLIESPSQGDEKPLAELMPRIPAKSFDEAAKSFELQNGFTLELVAGEPLVNDPIDAAIDERNRIYVVEMSDYPFLPEQRAQKYKDQRAESWSRIRMLSDTDGDGQIDKSDVFADKLRWAQSVCCSKEGVYVLAPPHLYFMKDTDGDNVADLKEIICSGFSQTNVQGLANGMEWGRDNAIYFSSGLAGGELTIPARGERPERRFTPGRRDLRLDPSTNELTMVSGGQQFGHTIDDYGDRFICSNSNHIVHVTWPLHYLERNPQLIVQNTIRSIAKEGAAAVVFRKSPAEPWRLVRTARRAADPEFAKRLPPTELVPIGFFTSATGVTIYRGGLYPAEYRGNAFIGDVGGNLVHRKKLTPDGISFIAERTEANCEFLTSTDNWFRPVNFVNAPDGTLYILDMYRETIEHPASIPDDIKALCDLESGHDKGRIWRLKPPGVGKLPTPPNLGSATTIELVGYLSSPHGAIRDTAQRIIVERQQATAIEPLHALIAAESPQPQNRDAKVASLTRLHAAWALHGLKGLTAEDVLALLSDPDPRVQQHGIVLFESIGNPACAEQIERIMQGDSKKLRWQWALSLGQFDPSRAVPGLRKLAKDAASDEDLRNAWLSSAAPHVDILAIELLEEDSASAKPLLVDLSRLIGSSSKSADALRLLQAATRASVSETTRFALLIALGDGLRRRGTTVGRIVNEAKATETAIALGETFSKAAFLARETTASDSSRYSAISLLSLADPQLAEATLPSLLTPQTAPALQQAAIKSLATQGTKHSIELMLEPWKTFGPGSRREVVDQLVSSAAGASELLSFVESGSIKIGEIERDKRQLLLNHPIGTVREHAKRTLAEAQSSRVKVVADYQPALELTGDADRGRLIYRKTCIQCHRATTEGHQVGPDLVSVQNKSPADLLVAILDPNREAQPSFQSYTAVTKQGTIHTGIISAETSATLTLKRAEAKEDFVLRDSLDELISTGQSLMPEGLEKDLDRQSLADIVQFIKSQTPGKK